MIGQVCGYSLISTMYGATSVNFIGLTSAIGAVTAFTTPCRMPRYVSVHASCTGVAPRFFHDRMYTSLGNILILRSFTSSTVRIGFELTSTRYGPRSALYSVDR